MIIRQEQMKMLEEAGQGLFEAEMLEHLKQTYPRAMHGADDTCIRELVSKGCERARGHGFQARGPVRMYLEYSVILGHQFDEDPMLYWVRDILGDSKDLDEMTQASRLHLHVSTYLNLVYGPEGVHVTKGLEHIANTQPAELVAVGRAYQSSAIPWLQALHPRKCAYAGPDALNSLLQTAQSAAAQFHLPEPEGPPLVLGLMFAFGAGVMTDPLFPWVAASIAPETAPEPRARMERLIARTQGYLRQALENRKKE
jgi:hypothetical protein